MTKNQAIDAAKQFYRESGDPYYVVKDGSAEFYVVLNKREYKERLAEDAAGREFVVFSIE